MKKQILAWTLSTAIAVLPAIISTSCSDSSADDAETVRNELEAEEKRIEAERKTRERENDVRLNEINNRKK